MHANLDKKLNNSNKSEIKSRRTLMSTTAFVAIAMLSPSITHAQTVPTNSWDYDVVLDGNVGKDTSVVGVTDITVTGGNGFVEGNADIYTGHTVNVTGNDGATFAYRDNRANIESTLNGNLNSNMKVVIIDKDGVFFGSGFTADVQSIVATTGHVEVTDIMDGGQLTISDVDQGGAITQNGTITIAEAGLAAFVAPTVENNGIINAKLARVQIGAAKTATVDLYGDGLLEIALDDQLSDALIENNGGIFAEGGVVQMTAMAAKGTVDNVVNNTGVISVASAVQEGGRIILSGGSQGTVSISGSLDASGTSGGEVEISGERIETLVGADIDASGTVDGGKVTIATDFIALATPSKFIKATGAGGTVQFGRLTKGRVSVGDYSGGIHLSQYTLNNIDTENLIIGDADSSKNKVTEINVRSIDTTSSVSGLVQLNALVSSDLGHERQNEGDVEFDSGVNSFNSLEVNALDDVNLRKDIVVQSLVGDMVFNADADANDVTGDTNRIEFLGDNATLISAGDIRFTGQDYVDVYEGTSITANSIEIERSKVGRILLGGTFTEETLLNEMQIDQGELDNFNAQQLIVGDVLSANNKVSEINVQGFDTTSSISGLVQMNSLAAIPGGGHKNEGDVEFDSGVNKFNTLEVNARDDVIFRTDVTVETEVGDMVFNADVDSDSGSGDSNIIEFLGNGNSTIESAGDITFSGQDYVDVHDNTVVRANGGLGTVNFERSSNGVIGLGEASGDMQIDQGELDNIFAGTLNVGNPLAANSNTTDVNVQNADVSHINNVNLYALAASTVNFSGVNSFANLNAYASSSTGVINVLDGVVNASNRIHFDAPLVNLNGVLNAPVITGTATTVNVQSDNAQIQDGVDVAKFSGATVNVAAGTYNENVNVYKEVTLRGANAGVAGYNPRRAESVVTPAFTGFNVSSDNVVIDGFQIDGGFTGISAFGVNNTSIVNNLITGTGGNAVEITSSRNLTVSQNKITEAAFDGVNAFDVQGADIIDNEIDSVGIDGIHVDAESGMYLFARTAFVNDNVVKDGKKGPEIVGINIVNNRINNSGEDGINTVNVDDLTVTGNNVSESSAHGFYAQGANNGDIQFQGNALTDNGQDSGSAAARFESGDVDMSDINAPNTFVNTTGTPAVAMQFEEVNDLIFQPLRISSERTFIDDELDFSFGNGLRIVNETLGSTVFNGYTPAGSFYVRFEDGAILDEVTNAPIVIDGTNASFDGIVPSLFSNVLTTENYNFIEDRLFDADDAALNGRGQIFVGDEEETEGVTNFEDFLIRRSSNGEGEKGGAILEIRGLPLVGLGSLNDIAPAAGEENNGDSAEDVANISPEAGGDDAPESADATCIGDVVSSLTSGSVTYSFGGTSEESIVAASSCSTSTGT